jgi:hypothetical protein
LLLPITADEAPEEIERQAGKIGLPGKGGGLDRVDKVPPYKKSPDGRSVAVRNSVELNSGLMKYF